EELVRRQFHRMLTGMTPEQRLELLPAPGLGRWGRRLGLGNSQAQERAQWLTDALTKPVDPSRLGGVRPACAEANLELDHACTALCDHVERTESHNTAGLMRRNIYQGFARCVFTGDESGLATFLTYGFAELDFQVRPSRQDLVLALFKVLMEVFLHLKIPVVVA